MEKLPNEMAVQIFDLLDSESLKNASVTCKDWRNSIFGSQQLMNQFKLKVHNSEEQKSFLQQFGPSFRNVCATSNLSLENGNPNYTHKKLEDFLKLVRNVENLEIGSINMTLRCNKIVEMNLPNLKTVKLHNEANTYRISNFLGSSNLLELTMDVQRNWDCYDQGFLDWLCEQDRLKSLNFWGFSLKEFLRRMQLNFYRITFRLKKLYMTLHSSYSHNVLESLFNFISQQNEIEKLVLIKQLSPYIINDMFTEGNVWVRIIRQILTNCNQLKYLEFSDGFSFDSHDIRGIENRSLEALIFKASSRIPTPQLISLAPNLKHLDITIERHYMIDITFQDFMSLLSTNTPNLEVLKLMKLYLNHEEDYQNLRLPNLKELSLVTSLINHTNWKSIVEKCPSIEKLHLELFAFHSKSLTFICQHLKNFKELNLGCGLFEQNLLEPLESCTHFRRLIISPGMRNQFNNVLENAEFDVVVNASLSDSFKKSDLPQSTFNYFRHNRTDLINFDEFLDNFGDYTAQLGL